MKRQMKRQTLFICPSDDKSDEILYIGGVEDSCIACVSMNTIRFIEDSDGNPLKTLPTTAKFESRFATTREMFALVIAIAYKLTESNRLIFGDALNYAGVYMRIIPRVQKSIYNSVMWLVASIICGIITAVIFNQMWIWSVPLATAIIGWIGIKWYYIDHKIYESIDVEISDKEY